jgi:hypothetical protein
VAKGKIQGGEKMNHTKQPLIRCGKQRNEGKDLAFKIDPENIKILCDFATIISNTAYTSDLKETLRAASIYRANARSEHNV